MLFCGYTPVSSHPSLSLFLFPISIFHLSMRHESPGIDRSGNIIPLLQTQFCSDRNIHLRIYVETVDFILMSRCVDALSSAFLLKRHNHALKISRSFCLALILYLSESNSHLVYNPVGISGHIE